MELTYPEVSARRIEKLHDELIAAGIYPEFVLPIDSDTKMGIRLIVPDGTNEGIVNAIVEAHNPETPSQAEIEFTNDKMTMTDLKNTYQNMKDGLVTIRSHMTQIKNGPNNPTAVQTGTALKLIADDVTTMTNGLDKLLDTLKVVVKRS